TLHERRITDFDGPFAEWESVSAERAHAAQVRASEEEALRRHDEKKKTARRETASRDARANQRKAQREVEDLERKIQSTEERIQAITSALDDPELYTTPDGVARARAQGQELDVLKVELERSLDA